MKDHAPHALKEVDGDVRFRFCTGDEAGSMHELLAGLSRLDEGSFSHHANEQKNDFSAWVRDVLGDERLAQDLGEATREQASALVKARLAFLTRTLTEKNE